MSLLIQNGRVVDPKNNIDTKLDVFIEKGKISEI
jgi:dihydroorotase-like cyclic amidohydrolase